MRFTRFSLLAGVTIGAMALAAPAMAQVTLKIWSGDNSERPYPGYAYSKEFDEQNNDIVIEHRYVPNDEVFSELLRAVATGNAPDIATLGGPDFPLFSSRGALLDITDRVAASTVINPDNYFPGPWNALIWDGRLFGIPEDANSIALFYNKDLFAEAGLAAPPQTWTQLVEYAEKLTDPSRNIYGATFSARADEEGTFQFLPIIQMSGGDYDNVNTEGATEVLDLWKKMIDNGWASRDVLSLGQWDSTGTFNSGNAAMAISGPWELDRMVADAKFDWGVALLPTLSDGGERASALGGYALGILATTQHPDEAFRLLEYFAEQDHRVFEEFSNIPSRSDIALPETGIARKDEGIKVFQEQLQYARPRGPHPEWPKMNKAIYDAMQLALTGQLSSRAALDQAQSVIDDILASTP